MQEDDFKMTAFNFHFFLEKFKIPVTKEDVIKKEEAGFEIYHPSIKSYIMRCKP